MENFKQKLRGGFSYKTAPLGDVVKVEVYYYKEGRPRGIVFSMRSVKLEENTSSDGSKYMTESFALFSGLSVYVTVKALERKSDKVELAVAEAIDPIIPKLVELFNAGNKLEIHELLRATMEQSVR